jgi:hypothetical protein
MLWNKRRLATLARRTMAKATTLAAAVLVTTLKEAHMKVPATSLLTVTERSPDSYGRSSESTDPGKQSVREPPPCLNTKKCAGEKHYLSDCPHSGKDDTMYLLSSTRKRGMPTKRRRTLRLWEKTERRRTTEMARPRISRQRISESRSRYWRTQALNTLLYRAVLWRTQESVASLSRSRCC